MKTITRQPDYYKNLGYGFLLLIVLVPIGFYYTYFVTFPKPDDFVIHTHFALMCIWLVLLVVQPFLIKYKKRLLHRSLGKVSYVVVPLIMLSTIWIIRTQLLLTADELAVENLSANPALTNTGILYKAFVYLSLPIAYTVWLGVFYTAAIVYRKNPSAHARYMMAAGLTATGPILDRIFFANLGVQKFFGVIPVEFFAFLLIDVIVTLMLLHDHRHNRSIRTLGIVLSTYLAVQVLYLVLTLPYW